MSLEKISILKRPFRIRARKSRFGQPCSLPEELYRQFSLAELQLAHSEWICGYYYKGVVDGGGTSLVTVKSFRSKKEFQDEIQLLCQLRHQNIIHLLGYCKEKGEHLAVYEHTSHGSLADHLHPDNPDPLPWKRRLEICIGAASGLHYLHTGVKHAIFHLDVNSCSILLDRNWAAKISEFGSFRISSKPKPKPKPLVLTHSRPSPFRKMAAEYYTNGDVTEKFDVFLLGEVLLEVFSGQLTMNETYLISEISRRLQEGNIKGFMDPYLRGKIAPMCCKEFVEIALSCIHPEPSQRPSMGEVEVTLQLALELQEKADSVASFDRDSRGYTYEQVHFQVPVTDYLKDLYDFFGYRSSGMLHYRDEGESYRSSERLRYSDEADSFESYSVTSPCSDDVFYEGR